MPDTISREPWHITDGTTELYFDVPGEIVWQRQYRGRTTQPLCGSNTVTVRGLSKRNVRIQIQINPGALRNTRKEAIIAMAETNALYQLTPPGGEVIPVKFDPSSGFEERWNNGRRLLTVGFQETEADNITTGPPPGLPPGTLWATPEDLVFEPETVNIPVTLSWVGHSMPNIHSLIWIVNLAHTTFFSTGVVIPQTTSGVVVDVVGTATPPAGTYQWVLKALTGEPYAPIYSAAFTVTRP